MIVPIVIGGLAILGITWRILAKRSADSDPKNPTPPPKSFAKQAIGVQGPAPSAAGGQFPVGALAQIPVPPTELWSTVEFKGKKYNVAPFYIGPARIGEAADLAKARGWVLPTPGLVDAIWKQADLKLMPNPNSHNGTAADMNSAARAVKQADFIQKQIAGRDFKLLGGTHKDIIVSDTGKHGIYGWHVANEDIPAFNKKYGFDVRKIGGPPVTPGLPGNPIQGANTTAHGPEWGDYSQGLRPIVEIVDL